ncbi:glycosyltransferase family 4 protein [Vibrio splendidus]
MKITHFISSPASGGAEVYVKDLSIEKVKLGHSVHVLFLSNAADIGRNKQFENKFLEELDNAGVTYSFVGNRARRNPLLGIIKVREHIKKFEPDILHCHLYYALVFSLFTKKINVIYTHHNIKLKIPSFAYKLFDFRVSAYVGICQACTDIISRVTNKPVYKIDNAVSTERIIPKKEYSYSEIPQVLMVGHLSEQKNYHFLFEVVKLLKDKNFVVSIAGEGPDFQLFEKIIKDNNLESKVNLLGNVSNVPSLMNRSDIFAMTSAWEGLPIALIEATLTGLPTIVTSVGGCAEVSHQSLNGFVIDTFCSNDYAKKLSTLLDSFELRRELSRNALSYSMDYTLVRCVEKHIDLYSKVNNKN